MSDSLRPHGLYSPWNSLGQNTGVGSLSLLLLGSSQPRDRTQLLHCRQILNQLSHKGSLDIDLVFHNSRKIYKFDRNKDLGLN